MAHRYPIDAEQYQRYEKGLRLRRNTQDIVYTQKGDGGASAFPETTRTRPPLKGTPNWNNAPYQGYNMDHLNTYMIPRHDQKQLSLFSKYILDDPNAMVPGMVERVQQRFKERHPNAGQAPFDKNHARESAREVLQGNHDVKVQYGSG